MLGVFKLKRQKYKREKERRRTTTTNTGGAPPRHLETLGEIFQKFFAKIFSFFLFRFD